MRLLTFFLSLILAHTIQTASAQNTAVNFTGAEATLSHYKALYVLNSGDDKKIQGTLRNIKNSLADVRLKDKLEIELVVFGDGVKVFAKDGPYEGTLKALQSKGVILAQCENTIRERKIDKNSLYSFISYVPSGAGEMIIREQQGWAIIHP